MENPPTTRAEAEAYLYNQQNGKPTKFDPDLCAMEINEHGRCKQFYQCSQKPNKGPDGLYCWRHEKELTARGIGARTTQIAPNDLRPKWTPTVGARCEYNLRRDEWFKGKISAVRFTPGQTFVIYFRHPTYDWISAENVPASKLRAPTVRNGTRKKAGQAQAAALKP